MTRPGPVLRDRSCHSIRNTRNKMEFFFPTPMLRWCFMFLLAAMSRRYNIGIVAYAMMPTHLHIIVNPGEDPDRPFDLPEFKKQLHANWAKIVNAYWDESGHVMCRDSVGDCFRIVDEVSELQQLSYVECNGVAAGMGRRPEDLKGAVSQRIWLTQPKVVARPPFYFQERTWEESEILQLCVPKLLKERGVSREQFLKDSQKRLLKDLRRTRRRVKKSGVPVRTLRQLEKNKPTPSFEKSSADHSQIQMVGQDSGLKAQEYHRLAAFWAWHADSLRRVREGEEDVVFPPGTYKAARKYGARVASVQYYQAAVRRRDEGRLGEKFGRILANDEDRVRVQLE